MLPISPLFQSDTSLIQGTEENLAPPLGLPNGLQITRVFNTFWRFAAERQEVFFRRIAGQQPPWTDDPILLKNKFTNVYRASDRVSQYLIQRVIGNTHDSPTDLFFKIILFKLFNKIETWELLLGKCGAITWNDYSFERYDSVLGDAIQRGQPIYSAAYIMPSGGKGRRKHTFHLQLLERMMSDEVAKKLQDCRTMRAGFELLRSYHSIGNFLAYQFLIDLNYSDLVDFSEMDFVMPGPGAKDGIRKCFTSKPDTSEETIIRWMAETQAEQFERLGLRFRDLWGRRIHLIDCQNLFCEVDKYARYAHPEIRGVSGRQRIKQVFRASALPIAFSYPPKWRIYENLQAFGANWGQADAASHSSAAD